MSYPLNRDFICSEIHTITSGMPIFMIHRTLTFIPKKIMDKFAECS